VRVTREPANARYARVVVIRRDPLADPKSIPWPLAQAERVSLWQPIPVGVDEDGSEVALSLPERNLLAGGEPGAGKSTIVQLLIAAAALDPSVRLTLFDPKLVELAIWQACGRLVGPSVDQAIDALNGLIAELDDRYLTLLANRARKVAEGDGLPLHLLVVEELAFYTNGPDRKAAQVFSVLLRDFVARGRAAGMVTVATTQKPSADVVPTYLRDLFGFRWALRCSTPDASDTILGRGWASQGYSAASVDPAARGVGWLLQEGGVPVRLRSCYLDDLDLAELARRAEQTRGALRSERPTLRLVDGTG
jgi:DNA segregation ATPase FtsK/SpoIIIE-like protein